MHANALRFSGARGIHAFRRSGTPECGHAGMPALRHRRANPAKQVFAQQRSACYRLVYRKAGTPELRNTGTRAGRT